MTSGFITPGETAEESAIREAKEELGIDLKTLEYAGTYWYAEREQLMHGFIAFSPKCVLKISSEVDSADWIPSQSVPDMIFPDSPGNAAFAVYKYYERKKAKERAKK